MAEVLDALLPVVCSYCDVTGHGTLLCGHFDLCNTDWLQESGHMFILSLGIGAFWIRVITILYTSSSWGAPQHGFGIRDVAQVSSRWPQWLDTGVKRHVVIRCGIFPGWLRFIYNIVY